MMLLFRMREGCGIKLQASQEKVTDSIYKIFLEIILLRKWTTCHKLYLHKWTSENVMKMKVGNSLRFYVKFSSPACGLENFTE